MAVKQYTLTLNGSAQRLSSVFSNQADITAEDIGFYQLILAADPANAAAVYIGGLSTVSSTAHGFALDPTQATAKDRESLGPFTDARIKLSQLYAIGGNNERLMLLGIY